MSVAMHLVWLARPSCLWDGLANRTSHHVIEPQIHPSVSPHYKEMYWGAKGYQALHHMPPIFCETVTLPPLKKFLNTSLIINYVIIYN